MTVPIDPTETEFVGYSPTSCIQCRAPERHVYDMACSECRKRLVTRGSDIAIRRKELRGQMLEVIRMSQGEGVARQTDLDTQTK